MTSKYGSFIFKDYSLDKKTKLLKLTYGYDDKLTFRELYKFDFDWAEVDEVTLDRAVQQLFFIAGVSYYKTYLSPKIQFDKGQLDKAGADFFSKTYQKGLGEFFYVNQLDPHSEVPFPANVEGLPELKPVKSDGILLGIGGGKDSLVSAELLQGQPNLATWSLNHRPQLTPLVKRLGTKHFWVEREWDAQLLSLNEKDGMNGHVPISAIFSCVGVIVALLSGYKDVVVSNESSANEPTLEYKGVPINHQYSKSLEYEQDFQGYLKHLLGDSVRYYSLLRPLSELHISQLFAKRGFDKYYGVFSSCNRAFVHSSDRIFWDGTCPKCAFVFLALTPFVEQAKLEALFKNNLLLEPALEPTYRQLLGIEGDKPLECVGEIKESRMAMRLAGKKYPELSKYQFELPEDYDYKKLSGHSMPSKLLEILKTALD